jgi:hypothetical protein
MIEKNFIGRILEVEKYFAKSARYSSIVRDVMKLYEAQEFELCKKDLRNLPSKEELLKELCSKLKSKSVGKTLKLLQEGKVEENSVIAAKGLSSLLTHILIESETNSEYLILVPSVLDKLTEILYGL